MNKILTFTGIGFFVFEALIILMRFVYMAIPASMSLQELLIGSGLIIYNMIALALLIFGSMGE